MTNEYDGNYMHMNTRNTSFGFHSLYSFITVLIAFQYFWPGYVERLGYPVLPASLINPTFTYL